MGQWEEGGVDLGFSDDQLVLMGTQIAAGMYALRAVQFYPDGGRFHCVRSPKRTTHRHRAYV